MIAPDFFQRSNTTPSKKKIKKLKRKEKVNYNSIYHQKILFK
jgi:hypothetical protein